MLRLAILALLTIGGLAFTKYDIEKKLDTLTAAEWILYKDMYNKAYEPKEDVQRFNIWKLHKAIIAKHNEEAKAGKHTYTLGMNAFADMSNEEFVKIMNGYKMSMKKPAQELFRFPPNLKELPTTVDWRDKGYVTPVKNQGQCGSCWAFSATGSLEGQHFNKTGKLVSLSEQNLVDCSQLEGNVGCEGGVMDAAFTYIAKNNGIDTEVYYPYKAKDEECHFSRANVGATCFGYVDIQRGSEKDLQAAVATVGPISVAIDASHTSFQLYKDGVYDEPNCSTYALDHGVLAVGYGVHEDRGYWLVKNSWGADWGMEGYIMMSRNRDNQCGIATLASYPKV